MFAVQRPHEAEDEVQDVAVEQRGLGAEQHAKDLGQEVSTYRKF